jgi:hypothetical protein
VELGKRIVAVFLTGPNVLLPRAIAEMRIQLYDWGTFIREFDRIAS